MSSRPNRRSAAAGILVATALAACGGDDGDDRPARAAAKPAPPPARAKAAPARPPGTLAAVLRRPVKLRAKPRGKRVVARVRKRTQFGSETVLAVFGRRDGWLKVGAAELPNNRFGWVDERAVKLAGVRVSATVDLSERRLTVRRDGRVLRRITVAVGRPGAESPRGRFGVTDRIRMRGGPYGCCAIALTAHQPSIPQGWTGGDRVAIHATPNTWTIGRAVSLGCFRTTNANMRWLMRTIELGTQVEVRS